MLLLLQTVLINIANIAITDTIVSYALNFYFYYNFNAHGTTAHITLILNCNQIGLSANEICYIFLKSVSFKVSF